MPVFKCTLLLLKKNFVNIAIYLTIFIFLQIMLSNTSPASIDISNISLDITVINADNSEAGEAIKNYLGETHNLVELPNEKELLQDQLFYRNTEYILIIPEGFEESLSLEKPIPLQSMKVPNSYSATYIGMQVDRFMRYLNTYLTLGTSLDESIKKTNEALQTEAEVHLLQGYTGEHKRIYSYYQFLSYIIIGISITAVSSILVSFNKEEINRRTESSSHRLLYKNLEMILSCILFAFSCWIVFTSIAAIMYSEDVFSEQGLYCMLNSLAAFAVSFAIAFLIGITSKTSLVVTILANVLSLGMSFISGVFVPQEMLSDGLLSFARFLPVYWYINVNNALADSAIVGDTLKSIVREGILVQMSFFCAIIVLALTITKYKKDRMQAG